MYVCVAGNGEMLVFSSFIANNSLNRQFQGRGFEPYGVVSWPQGAVTAPPPPFQLFFLAFFSHFSKLFMYAWGKKEKMLVF